MMLPSMLMGLGTLTLPQQSVAQMIVAAAADYPQFPQLAQIALGVAAHESGFNPSATNVNSNGTTDYGVMQLNTTTVQTLGVSNPLDPQQNINAGVGLLAQYLQQYGGNVTNALWAYASGPGAVSSGNMNPTASSFISYVTSYTPDPSLDLSGSSTPSLNLETADGSSDTSDDSSLSDIFGSLTTSTVSIMGYDVPTLVLGGVLLLVFSWVAVRKS
jgi:hypothetical protein